MTSPYFYHITENKAFFEYLHENGNGYSTNKEEERWLLNKAVTVLV